VVDLIGIEKEVIKVRLNSLFKNGIVSWEDVMKDMCANRNKNQGQCSKQLFIMQLR
jgi:hypothetical protein